MQAATAALAEAVAPSRKEIAAMAGHRLTKEWTKIASAGDGVTLTNIGNTPIVLSNTSRPLVPGGNTVYAGLRSDLSARAAEGSAQLSATVTQGMLRTYRLPLTRDFGAAHKG